MGFGRQGLRPPHEAAVIELLLVTTVPPMMLAAGGMPSLGLIAAVLVGGALGRWREHHQLLDRALTATS